jgi:hypothetical protein
MVFFFDIIVNIMSMISQSIIFLWYHSFYYDIIVNIISMISYVWYWLWYHSLNYDIIGKLWYHCSTRFQMVASWTWTVMLRPGGGSESESGGGHQQSGELLNMQNIMMDLSNPLFCILLKASHTILLHDVLHIFLHNLLHILHIFLHIIYSAY